MKEPWEMTRSEYLNWYLQEWDKAGVRGVKADEIWAWNNHKYEVEQAISEGKSVPAKVLNERVNDENHRQMARHAPLDAPVN